MDRVFLHIGQPKTGTTYLQSILWANRDRLAADGVVLPGSGHREHLWAALDIQERPKLAQRDPRAPGTWKRLCDELASSSARAGLITHEFFCGATGEQASRAVEDLAPAEIDVIVTARDAAGMLSAGWQEMVKHGQKIGIRQAAAENRTFEFSWQTWDLEGVLRRWSEAVPVARFHVLPVPGRGAPPNEHWRNFAEVLGLRGDYPMPEGTVNRSLGAVQVELLRRVNGHLSGFSTAFDPKVQFVRGYLAEGLLVSQGGERFVLGPDVLEDCRRRSRRAVDYILEEGVPVLGDVSSLLVPDEPPKGRDLASIEDGELLDSATRLIVDMLEDVRRLQSELDTRRSRGARVRDLARRVRDRLRRRATGAG